MLETFRETLRIGVGKWSIFMGKIISNLGTQSNFDYF